MPSNPLANYLKSYRKQSSLTQKELAFLIDAKSRTAVAKHESSECLPALDTIVCYELLFGAKLRDLYEGRFRDVELLLIERVNGLLFYLERQPESLVRDQKIRTLKRFLGEDITGQTA